MSSIGGKKKKKKSKTQAKIFRVILWTNTEMLSSEST